MGKTLLIVDDEVDVLDTLKEAFELEGYQVLTAPNGALALDALATTTELPCVAILDVYMPTMTGVELYAAMQSDARLAPMAVIFCTSAPSAAPPGVTVLKKPVDFDRLASAVRQRCNGA